jgi:hypothetical protein
MSLIPIEHPRRLGSPAEAEGFFRALGEKRVSARGFQTTDAARFTRLVEAIETKHDHTISFLGGTLGSAARDSLAALAMSQFEYLDVRTTNASLRVWPALRSWVHPGNIETEKPQPAIEAFLAVTEERHDRGFIMNGVVDQTKPALARFLVDLKAQVDAVLLVDIASARSLTEAYVGEKLDWQAAGVLVDFPDGRIHGFLKTPNVGEEHRAKWLRTIEKALSKMK